MTKILLVEDDKALREIYGVRLLAEGYDIISAGDGEEALAVAIREKPELIISDVMMPKISGFEMLDLLRNNEVTKGIKVIMMTALSGDQHRDRGESLGADRYLVKSQAGIEDVVNTVHEVLGDRNAAAPAGTAPAAPAPNQSPVNPPQATAPNVAAGVPAPALPPTPPNVPVVTTPNVPVPSAPVAPPPTPTSPPAPTPPTVAPPAPIAPAAPTPAPTPPPPVITPVADTPTAPPPPVSTPDLTPVAPPANASPAPTLPAPNAVPPAPLNPPAPTSEVPSFQPPEVNPNADQASEQPTPTPAVDLAQSSTGARVIQPTGETISPQIDINNLIANDPEAAGDPSLFPSNTQQ